jgi:hypothetical protein
LLWQRHLGEGTGDNEVADLVYKFLAVVAPTNFIVGHCTALAWLRTAKVLLLTLRVAESGMKKQHQIPRGYSSAISYPSRSAILISDKPDQNLIAWHCARCCGQFLRAEALEMD